MGANQRSFPAWEKDQHSYCNRMKASVSIFALRSGRTPYWISLCFLTFSCHSADALGLSSADFLPGLVSYGNTYFCSTRFLWNVLFTFICDHIGVVILADKTEHWIQAKRFMTVPFCVSHLPSLRFRSTPSMSKTTNFPSCGIQISWWEKMT